MLVHSHKVGRSSFSEYMRLCAAGKDLSSAFEWYQYWQAARLDGWDSLSQLTWLLYLARLSPSDDRMVEMAALVQDVYEKMFCEAAAPPVRHFQATTAEEEEEWCRFVAAFQQLEPFVESHAGLRAFIQSLTVKNEAKVPAARKQSGWPVDSHHHVFPNLEQGLPEPEVSVTVPQLKDSLLHPLFLQQLQQCAMEHNISKLVALLEKYEAKVQREKEHAASGQLTLRPQGGAENMDDVWRQHRDATAVAFRKKVVDEGGLTPELYHYLITALAPTQPSVVLRTLERMREAELRPIDLTRVVALIAARGSWKDQVALFSEQLAEIDARQRLDEDNDIVKVVEVYWKMDYVSFFHYRNALNTTTFYRLLMEGIGVQEVQKLIMETGNYEPHTTTEDIVLLDTHLREAATVFFRNQIGPEAVQGALDVITNYMPKLDIALMNDIPHFHQYCLNESDDIATSMLSLSNKLSQFDIIYVLDTSFIETSESFSRIGIEQSADEALEAASTPQSATLMLVPYLSLSQLADSVSGKHQFISFDPALQQDISEESFLASQRLRSVSAMVHQSTATPEPTSGTGHRQVRILHFTECLMANMIDRSSLQSLDLSPDVSENDLLLTIVAMTRSVMKADARLILCTDDPQLHSKLAAVQNSSLFRGGVEVLRTTPPSRIDIKKNLINDNPDWDSQLFETFTPQLQATAALAASERNAAMSPAVETPLTVETEPTISTGDAGASPWLALLQNEEADADTDISMGMTVAAETSLVSPSQESAVSPSPEQEEPEVSQDKYEALMEVYASPLDSIPIGVRMSEASKVGSVFAEFGVMEADQRAIAMEEAAARRNEMSPEGQREKAKRHRPSLLEKEMHLNRGASNKQRTRFAKHLSNQSGGRVPFNLRYRVVKANVEDPQNAPLRKMYEEGLKRNRTRFKRDMSSSRSK